MKLTHGPRRAASRASVPSPNTRLANEALDPVLQCRLDLRPLQREIQAGSLALSLLEGSDHTDLALALCDGDTDQLPATPGERELKTVDVFLVGDDRRDRKPGEMLGSELAGPAHKCLHRGICELAKYLRGLAKIGQLASQIRRLPGQFHRQPLETFARHVASVSDFRCYTAPTVSVGRSGIAVGAGFAASGALLLLGRQELAFTGFLLSFGAFCFQTEISLNWQIGLGSLLGIGFELWLGDASVSMGTLGGIFISALKMLVAPMVLLSIAVGIGGMGDARELGVLGSGYVAVMRSSDGSSASHPWASRCCWEI